MNISFAKQWAAQQLAAGTDHIAAQFIMAALTTPSLSPDKLAAIQRSFQPIDDSGTLRMEVRRADVDALLTEVLRLRAVEVAGEVELSPEIFVKEGEPECRAPAAPIADEKPQPLEPASLATNESDTSDAETATTARPELRSPRRR